MIDVPYGANFESLMYEASVRDASKEASTLTQREVEKVVAQATVKYGFLEQIGLVLGFLREPARVEGFKRNLRERLEDLPLWKTA